MPCSTWTPAAPDYDPESVSRGDGVYAELVDRLGPYLARHVRVPGRQHQIDLGNMETDFMEADVLRYVEPLIQAATPYEVVHRCTGDQTDCIVLLSSAERDRLTRERPALFDFENAYD